MVHNYKQSSQSAGDKLAYEGTVIRKRGSMLNLTDMWRAAGGQSARRPSLWLALDETAHFRKFVRIHTVGNTTASSGLNVGQDDIMDPLQDGLVVAGRGKGGATWAHWQLALAYARYLSPPFHLWCNSVIRTVMEQPGLASPKGGEALFRFLESRFQFLIRRFDTADRHAADLMFLISSTQDILTGKRRDC
ncbi:KilA-N domain-containing protein [Acidisphaera sp. L21]|uniref:KilA-N domain-containing protein n=1 Tax=Acidisphaera sp. L21 TaxID=1641851 RepID=UPI00131D58E6|nr:KilA-N domain-containing protein [Acidisphaera sp. L21]